MQQKHILIGIALVILGGLVGWAVAYRTYGVGPLARLQGANSKADFEMMLEAGVCQPLYDSYITLLTISGGIWTSDVSKAYAKWADCDVKNGPR